MTGALKAAWALTLFVILVGAVLWAVTGRAVFAAFMIIGILTGAFAVVAGRTGPGSGKPSSSSSKEEPTS